MSARFTGHFHRLAPQLPDQDFKRLLWHLEEVMHAWKYVPNQDELLEARDQNLNILATKMNVFLPLLATRPKSTLNVMKAVIRVCSGKESPTDLRIAMRTLSQALSLDMKLVLKPLLGQLMHNFLLQNTNFTNFPFGIVANDLKSFLMDNDVLIPILLSHYAHDDGKIQCLSDLLQKSVAKIIEENFAPLASIYIVTYILDANGGSDALNNLVTKGMPTEKHNDKLNSLFPEVLGLICRRLQDERHFEEIFGTKPDLDYIRNLTTRNVTLNVTRLRQFMSAMLQQSFESTENNESSLFCALVKLQPDCLQRLLTTVFQPLQGNQEEQSVMLLGNWQACFHAIWFILDTLDQDMKCNTVVQPYWPYVAWYTLQNCSFFYRVRKEEREVRTMCLRIIGKVLEVYVQLDEDWSQPNHVLYTSLPVVVNR